MVKKLTKEIKRVLHDIYFGNSEGAYSSLSNVYRVAKRQLPDLSLSVVREYLNGLPSYSLHKRAVRSFERRSFLAVAPWDTFSLDLFFYLLRKNGVARMPDC